MTVGVLMWLAIVVLVMLVAWGIFEVLTDGCWGGEGDW